jgi:hypothetical protein
MSSIGIDRNLASASMFVCSMRNSSKRQWFDKNLTYICAIASQTGQMVASTSPGRSPPLILPRPGHNLDVEFDQVTHVRLHILSNKPNPSIRVV